MLEIPIERLGDYAGTELGTSDWLLIDQDRVDAFAAATGDNQWIHVDVERADREIGGTIAHGFLVLSLLPPLAASISRFTNVSRALNYGCENIRFTNAVQTGKRIRLRSALAGFEPKSRGFLVRFDCTFEIEGEEKPACRAQLLGLYFPVPPPQ